MIVCSATWSWELYQAPSFCLVCSTKKSSMSWNEGLSMNGEPRSLPSSFGYVHVHKNMLVHCSLSLFQYCQYASNLVHLISSPKTEHNFSKISTALFINLPSPLMNRVVSSACWQILWKRDIVGSLIPLRRPSPTVVLI